MLLNDNYNTQMFFYELLLIVTTFLFVKNYKGNYHVLSLDFFFVLRLFVIHSMLGYLTYLLLPGYFKIDINLNKSFYYVFYVSNGEFLGLSRNTGLFWEPGVFQLVANLYLFYCIYFKRSTKEIVFALISVVSAFSTTGFYILIINLVYFLFVQKHFVRINILNILILIAGIVFLNPLIKANTDEKMSSENTSNLVRLRDLQIGFELIKERPIIGHGLFNSQYLLEKGYTRRIEQNLFYDSYTDLNGNMSGGYTNGILGFFGAFGIPIGLIFFFYYFRNRLVDGSFLDKFIFSLIPLVTMFSEPITLTSLFMLFPFSSLFCKMEINKHILIAKKTVLN